MVRSMAIPPTEEEIAFADQILQHANSHHAGSLTADAAVQVFNRSGLSRYELRDIWSLADADSNGVLAKDELLIALRVMGWVQSGKKFAVGLMDKPGPLPTIQGIVPPPKVPENELASSSSSPHYQALPNVLPMDVKRFHDMFKDAGPVNGQLGGDVVRSIYMKSDLSYGELSGIWNLVDRNRTGHLTFPEFAMGLHLIDALKSCRISTVPPSIPAYLFEQFEGLPEPTPPPRLEESRSPFLSPNEEPGPSTSRSLSPMPTPAKSPRVPPRPPPPLKPKPLLKPWAVTPSQKNEYDAEFAALDTEQTGLVPEEKALKFLRRYHLPVDELAHIWDLAAIRNDNYLNADEFAVAMYLVQDRLAGSTIPYQLPKFLIPPALRPISSPITSPRASTSLPPLSPKGKAPDPPFPIPTLNGQPMAKDTSISHRSTMSMSSSSFIESPTSEVTPGPPLSPTLNRSSTAHVPLKFLTENPSIRRDPLSRRRTSTVSGSGSNDTISPSPPTAGPTHPLDDPLDELRTETKTLRRQVGNLLEQLSSQNEYRTANERLTRENGDLKAKLGELENSMAAILSQMQRNDNALSDELSAEIGRLTRRVAELEQAETQLQQTVGILEVAKREVGDLRGQVRDLRSAEATHRVELEAARSMAEELERENEGVKARLTDMTKAMSEPGDERSSRELRVLLQDVTRENQGLKERTREMERGMEQLLLESRDTGRVETLKRENRELRMQMRDLEQVTAQLQSTHEDNHLQQLLVVMTRENEGMKVRIRDMQAGMLQVRGEHEVKLLEMQRKIEELTSENSRLKTQLQGSTRRDDEDMSVPPPAYDDNFIPPDTGR
ncbi:hypothetical protein D9611_011984 [Ephemerocybe angulata]|uniref:Uncharacterized protein n=1 Tax=Ephemerocybe angulata TaxID=980116 RepID=A0A8H5FF93_9AGAR|nr:hypothetical protein D9611_011984 [Tulosesus angulatus]